MDARTHSERLDGIPKVTQLYFGSLNSVSGASDLGVYVGKNWEQ